MSDDLSAFVTERLDEDEAAAKACEGPSPWKAAEDEHDSWIVTDATGEPVIYDEGTPTLNEAEHIARHDPARALREVAAKRAILAEHAEVGPSSKDGPICNACVNIEADPMFDDIYVPYPCKTVRLLAAVYSDHPDYKPEWAPEGAPDGT